MIAMWLALSAYAQDSEPDRVEVWTEGKLVVDLSKSTELEFAQHVRITPSPLALWEVLTDVGLQHEVVDWLDVGVGFRGGARDFTPGDLEPRFRAQADVRVKAKLEPFRFSLRERYQYRIPTAERGPRHTLRSKGQVACDVSDLVRVFVAVEPYVRLGEATPVDRVRVEGGASFDLPKRIELEAWVRLEEPLGDDGDLRTWMGGLGFKKSVPPKRKKKDDDDPDDDEDTDDALDEALEPGP